MKMDGFAIQHPQNAFGRFSPPTCISPNFAAKCTGGRIDGRAFSIFI